MTHHKIKIYGAQPNAGARANRIGWIALTLILGGVALTFAWLTSSQLLFLIAGIIGLLTLVVGGAVHEISPDRETVVQCAWCGWYRHRDGHWSSWPEYDVREDESISHGCCLDCAQRLKRKET